MDISIDTKNHASSVTPTSSSNTKNQVHGLKKFDSTPSFQPTNSSKERRLNDLVGDRPAQAGRRNNQEVLGTEDVLVVELLVSVYLRFPRFYSCRSCIAAVPAETTPVWVARGWRCWRDVESLKHLGFLGRG